MGTLFYYFPIFVVSSSFFPAKLATYMQERAVILTTHPWIAFPIAISTRKDIGAMRPID
jgi:hypothetical protein